MNKLDKAKLILVQAMIDHVKEGNLEYAQSCTKDLDTIDKLQNAIIPAPDDLEQLANFISYID